VAGLGPATHVFEEEYVDCQEGVDDRERARSRGPGVVPGSVQTTDFSQPDSRGAYPAISDAERSSTMRDDLLEARAAVDWAIAQVKVTQRRIEAWRESSPYGLRIDFDSEKGKKVIKYIPSDLPMMINVEAGVIVNSIRSSLDILAVALAARNGFPNSKDTSFPICGSVTEFQRGGLKKVKRLSPQDRATIERLMPYDGGDDMLYALHQMDITRKHRRLLVVHPDLDFSLGGHCIKPIWPIDLPVNERPKDPTILVWINPDAPDADAELTVEVRLALGKVLQTASVAPALGEFSSLAHSIIDRFDAP
jgi:hypothetical protein